MVSAAGALDSEGGKGQEAMEAMDMDSSKPTKKIPRNKFVIAYAVLASTISILFGYVGMGPVNWVLGAEIFPLRLRAKAGSLGVAVERGMSGVVSMTLLSISKAMTVPRTFYLFLAVSALCSIFIYFCVPKTKGKTLEEIVESFHVKPQESLDEMATDPSELEHGNRRGIPVKGGVVTGGVLTGGAVTAAGGAAGGAVTGGAVTGWLVIGGVLTGGAVTGGAVTGGAGRAGGAVAGGAVTGRVVIRGVLTGGAVTGGAVTGEAGGAVTGGAVTGEAGGAVTGEAGEVVTGEAVTGGVFQ